MLPLSPSTTYSAGTTPAIKAADLNDLEKYLAGIYAGQYTIKSLDVDGTGGNSAGASSGSVRVSNTDAFFQAGSSSEKAFLTTRRVAYQNVSTASGGSNPGLQIPLSNELRAINIPKAAVFMVAQMGGVQVYTNGGYNVALAGITSIFFIRVQFASAFDNVHYVTSSVGCLIGSDAGLVVENVAARTTTTADIAVFNLGTGAFINFTTVPVPVSISVSFNGQQTT